MVWDHSTYSKNRDRLLQADIARKFLKAILEHEKVKPLLSDEHFTVDGTLINAWAPMKSFVARKMAPPDQDTMPPAADGGAPPKTEAKLDLGPRRHCPSPHRPRATARTRRRTPPRCTGPRPRARVATRRSTSTGRSGRTRHTPRSPTRRHACSAKARARRPSSATWATRSPRTATGSWSRPA